jgi:hypothetical protein
LAGIGWSFPPQKITAKLAWTAARKSISNSCLMGRKAGSSIVENISARPAGFPAEISRTLSRHRIGISKRNAIAQWQNETLTLPLHPFESPIHEN